jgi:hypothetical protein
VPLQQAGAAEDAVDAGWATGHHIGIDYGYGVAADGAGNLYVTGRTLSTTFPGTVGLGHLGAGSQPPS